MFGSEKKTTPVKPASSVDTLIGQRTEIRGDLNFSGGLHVDGSVFGTIRADDSSGDAVIIVTEKGRVEGEIHAPHVVINGSLVGDIYARERVELATNARVKGNIHYKTIEMAAGSAVNGQLLQSESPGSASPAPVAVPAIDEYDRE